MIKFFSGWRRPTLSFLARVLDDCVREVRLSAMKLRIAGRALEERRSKGVDKMLMQTAITGFPISTSMMANMYIASAESSARKALKNVLRVDKALRESYPGIHAGRVGGELSQVISILKGVSGIKGLSEREIMVRADEVDGAAGMLAEIARELRDLAKLHGE